MYDYEEYVTFEQAKALKELGFNWPCRHYATKRDAPEEHYWNCTPELLICNSMMLDCEFAVPTQTMACRWLREEKGLSVYVTPEFYEGGVIENVRWYYRGQPLQNLRNQFEGNCKRYPTYESALSVGIDRALELLKGGEKCGCR